MNQRIVQMFEDRFPYPEEYLKRSADMLDLALDRVPYYREHWRKYDIGRGKPVGERYASYPQARHCHHTFLGDLSLILSGVSVPFLSDHSAASSG